MPINTYADITQSSAIQPRASPNQRSQLKQQRLMRNAIKPSFPTATRFLQLSSDQSAGASTRIPVSTAPNRPPAKVDPPHASAQSCAGPPSPSLPPLPAEPLLPK